MLSYVHLLQGKPHDALAMAQAAVQIHAEVGAVQDGEILVRLAHAEALYAVGSPEAAETLAAVRDTLYSRASRINDVALRLSFLENIPENARTVALARARLPVGPDWPED